MLWIACLLPLSHSPSHRHTFYLTIDWPCSLPLIPTFPDPHPQPQSSPFEQAEEAYSCSWSVCFSFWLSPTPLRLWIPVSHEPLCMIILFNHHMVLKKRFQSLSLLTNRIATLCHNLQVIPWVRAYFSLAVKAGPTAFTLEAGVIVMCIIVHSCHHFCPPSGCIIHHRGRLSTEELIKELPSCVKQELWPFEDKPKERQLPKVHISGERKRKLELGQDKLDILNIEWTFPKVSLTGRFIIYTLCFDGAYKDPLSSSLKGF